MTIWWRKKMGDVACCFDAGGAVAVGKGRILDF